MQRFVLLTLILLLAAGCQQDDGPLPTLANPAAIATGSVLTENAPPSGFDTVAFPRIDANLTDLPGWRYAMDMEFNGRFARPSREANARTQSTLTFHYFA